MLESRTHNRKVTSSSLSPAGILMGGVNVQRSLHLQYHDEALLSKAPNPQLPPAPWAPQHKMAAHCPRCVHGVCVCVFTAVCVHLHG